MSKPLNGGVKVKWMREHLEQSVFEVSKVMKMKDRHFRTEDYSLGLSPVWYHEGTGYSVIEYPQQLAIDIKSGNIFIADYYTKKIQLFNEAGHCLYHIPTPPTPRGLCLSDEFIFLLKIQISSKKTIKSVVTENCVFCMDISVNIYTAWPKILEHYYLLIIH